MDRKKILIWRGISTVIFRLGRLDSTSRTILKCLKYPTWVTKLGQGSEELRFTTPSQGVTLLSTLEGMFLSCLLGLRMTDKLVSTIFSSVRPKNHYCLRLMFKIIWATEISLLQNWNKHIKNLLLLLSSLNYSIYRPLALILQHYTPTFYTCSPVYYTYRETVVIVNKSLLHFQWIYLLFWGPFSQKSG